MSHSRTTIDLWSYRKRQALTVLSGLAIIAFAAYIYFLCASVMHVVVRLEVERDIQTLQSDLNNLEADFITAQHTVSARVASFDGFTDVKEKVFIDRSAPSLYSLSNYGYQPTT